MSCPSFPEIVYCASRRIHSTGVLHLSDLRSESRFNKLFKPKNLRLGYSVVLNSVPQ